MAFPQGIPFRKTLAFVTDDAGDSPEYEAIAGGIVDYPRTTPQGNTCGMNDINADTWRDRLNTNPPNLAGWMGSATGNATFFRIDVVVGKSYRVRTACGDGFYTSPTKLELFDSGNSLGLLSQTTTTGANKFRDAADNEWSATDWAANNVAVTAGPFDFTICKFKIFGPDLTRVAYLYIEDATPIAGYLLVAN